MRQASAAGGATHSRLAWQLNAPCPSALLCVSLQERLHAAWPLVSVLIRRCHTSAAGCLHGSEHPSKFCKPAGVLRWFAASAWPWISALRCACCRPEYEKGGYPEFCKSTSPPGGPLPTDAMRCEWESFMGANLAFWNHEWGERGAGRAGWAMGTRACLRLYARKRGVEVGHCRV